MNDHRAERVLEAHLGITPRPHDDDGQVYLGYFRKDKVLGFVWDGNIEHPIQVTREMGEPIIDTFELNLHGVDLVTRLVRRAITINPPGLFLLFQQACDNYADNHQED